MIEPPAELEVDWARELVSSGDDSHPEFADAISVLCAAIDGGAVEHAGAVAEALCLPGPVHDAARSYIYYFVAYAQDGFSTSLSNQSDDPGHYHGPAGDFRNESMVSDLVQELGISALPGLDSAARKLLRGGA